VSNHLRLNFDLVELLSRVDTNNATNHLGDYNHVSEMCLDEVGLLIWLSLLLCLAQLLDQTHRRAFETTVEPTASAGVDNITELIGGEVQESVVREYRVSLCSPLNSSRLVFGCMWMYVEEVVLVKVDAAIGKLSEGSLLLDLGGLNGVLINQNC
jgi:hypothetical protein